MKIETILDQIDLGSMALPEFQRGYVWNRDQVRGLMYSLYRKHPVGSLLVWVTKAESATSRGDQELTPGTVKLLLDGQQRITSLYGIVRGQPPKFFDGNVQAFTGLYFNLEDETFEFYSPTKMKDDPRWLSVTEVMCDGAGKTMQKLLQVPEFQADISTYLNRVNAIENIKAIDLHMEEVTGEDKTVDVVVDIFNRVNSGGTKLSKGDLTLAKICAEWPDARDEMKQRLTKWQKAGYQFKLDWLLRNINAVVTGEALFTAMRNVDAKEVRDGLDTTEKVIDRLLNLIASRLGLDHDRVLGSRYAIPLMSRYLVQRGGKLPNQQERDQLLYWYVHTILWGRYSGSTESKLNTDLEAIEDASTNDSAGALKRLIENLRQERANLALHESDFSGSSKGNRFYPMLYMMTRVLHARDWGTGDELTNHLLGHLSRLEVHHIFPKALLYAHGYKKRQVNAIANFTFLTQETNLEVSKKDPGLYIPAYEERTPGAIATHWIPMDPELWKVEHYLDFLKERRKLLAKAANDFLERLSAGSMPTVIEPEDANFVERAAAYVPGGIDDDEEEERLVRFNAWVQKRGLPIGELAYELIDEETGKPMAVLDLAWPDGLQEGLSQPVCLLIGEGEDVEEAASQGGYRFFSSVNSFRKYVREVVLAEAELEEADA
ncbi:GmrSD restriction endonuclease domain-containing protein [Aeoliella mucimassa]|uniref:GmrSD restriction endonucleases N-terminal domain-containing protein n=1 Tax=Aeoliella mucimassa TaxID=2527972 RepID=A0A518APS3_9BACT|nr:DUF262 domain-containing protein [Aeoliella mucimassa]QDU56723.1 hypothetical protein Pan181_29330 [Aeoliella mucimassa]